MFELNIEEKVTDAEETLAEEAEGADIFKSNDSKDSEDDNNDISEESQEYD